VEATAFEFAGSRDNRRAAEVGCHAPPRLHEAHLSLCALMHMTAQWPWRRTCVGFGVPSSQPSFDILYMGFGVLCVTTKSFDTP